MDLTPEQVRMLVQIERDMEQGRQLYVVEAGNRWAFPVELLTAVGLKSGETVSVAVRYQLQLLNFRWLKEQLADQQNAADV